jgi:hypothetical protein
MRTYRVYPAMDIRFPEGRDVELVEAMKNKAQPPWR